MESIDRGEVPALDVVRADATRAFRYMKSGGVSVLPLDVSYAIFAATARGVERIFELKNRKPTKPNGIVGNWDIFSDVLKTQPRDKDLVRCLTQDHDLPLGRLTWHDQPVRPEAIRRTALLTVEGERDDICAIGQTMAALDLCSGVRISQKRHHLQSGVGHYGVFSGSRWSREVYPRVRAMIEVTNH